MKLPVFLLCVLPTLGYSAFARSESHGIKPIDLRLAAARAPVVADAQSDVRDAAYGAKGDGKADDSEALAAASSAVAGGEAVRLPRGVYRIGHALSFGPKTRLHFDEGARLAPDKGVTVTLAGGVMAPVSQIFSNALAGQGAVKFAPTTQAAEIYPEWWGARRDGTTDDGLAIQAAGNALESARGGTLVFSKGTYRIYKAGTTYGSTLDLPPPANLHGTGAEAVGASGKLDYRNVCNFTNVSNVNLISRGAVLAIDPAREIASHYGHIFSFANCKNVKVDGFTVTGPARTVALPASNPPRMVEYRSNPNTNGIGFVYLVFGCQNVNLPNNTLQGVLAGVWAYSTTTTAPVDRTRDLHIGSLSLTDSYYGVKLNSAGFNTTIDDLRTDGIHRSLMATSGVKGIRANIHSKDNWAGDVLLKAYHGQGVEDVTLDYHQGADTRKSSINGRNVIIQWGDAEVDPVTGTSGLFKDIRLNLDITYAPDVKEKMDARNYYSSYYFSGTTALEFRKYTKDGTEAGQDRSGNRRAVENLTVTGAIRGTPSSGAGDKKFFEKNFYTIDMVGKTGDWDETDIMRNIHFENLRIENDMPVRLWLRPLKDTLALTNFHTGGVIDIPDGLASGKSSYQIKTVGSSFPNQYRNVGKVRGVAALDLSSGGQLPPALRGRIVTNRGAASDTTFTLPAATPGSSITLVRAASHAVTVRPTGTNTLPGGKLVLTKNGQTVLLRCRTAGVWEAVPTATPLALKAVNPS